MTDTESRPTSTTYDHCVSVYNAMKEEAKPEEGETTLIWVGHLTHVFRGLGLAAPMYTLVKRHLVTMGCMEQIRRGGGSAPSKWRLHKEPGEISFNNTEGLVKDKRRGGMMASLEQQIRDLTARLELVEKAVGIEP